MFFRLFEINKRRHYILIESDDFIGSKDRGEIWVNTTVTTKNKEGLHFCEQISQQPHRENLLPKNPKNRKMSQKVRIS